MHIGEMSLNNLWIKQIFICLKNYILKQVFYVGQEAWLVHSLITYSHSYDKWYYIYLWYYVFRTNQNFNNLSNLRFSFIA